jgi:ABC-2 type transport system permease protein
MPSSFELGVLTKAFFAYLPAMWVLIGIAVLMTALVPKVSAAVWGYLGFVFFMLLIGNMPGLLPEWTQNLTPMKFVSRFPMEEINYLPLAVLTLIAAGMTALGFVFYRKRDMLTA